MRVLITGITGFAGRHLAAWLSQHPELELHGIVRDVNTCPLSVSKIQLHGADLLNESALRAVLWLVQPQQIYHLAAFANPGQSFGAARQAWEANLQATLNLYDACLSEVRVKPRILFVSTGAVYGEAKRGEEITEETPLRPNNPYATSKAAADLASYQYWAASVLPIIRIRPFNQVGPGQSADFALGRFALELVRMERQEIPPLLQVGNLEAERDFTDVRDMVRAYSLVMERGEPGEVYNAASSASRPMRWFLDQLLKQTNVAVQIETDTSLLRPTETQRLRVNSQKLIQTTSWSPSIPLEQTLSDLLTSYRESLALQSASSRENQ